MYLRLPQSTSVYIYEMSLGFFTTMTIFITLVFMVWFHSRDIIDKLGNFIEHPFIPWSPLDIARVKTVPIDMHDVELGIKTIY